MARRSAGGRPAYTRTIRKVHELIIRSLQGRTSAAEESVLLNWRRESPGNEQEYVDTVRLWELTGRASQRRVGRVPDLAQLLRGAPSPPVASSREPRSARFGRGVAWRLAAATLLLAGGVAAGVMAGRASSGSDGSGFGVEEFVTGESQMASAQLGDGSVVRLAPHSRLRIVGSRKRRDLWLDGRAFFAVAKDAERPFVVHTSAGEAVALGTRFELNARGNALTLVMLQGRVALSANGGRTEVQGGEVGTVTRGAEPTVVNIANVYPMLNWVGEFLAFEATPLEDVSMEIGRRYGVKVNVDDPVLARRTVTAWFTDESLQEVIAVVCRVVDAQCTIDGATIDIRPRAGPTGI